MAEKNFMTSAGYAYDTLDEALKSSSRRATKNGEDVKVYQAIKLVSPKTPEVDVTDIVLK